MSRKALKPCPWCNKKPVMRNTYSVGIHPSGYVFWLKCTNTKCPVKPGTTRRLTPESAERDWNDR